MNKNRGDLRGDCKNCFGFCCVALYFARSEGFPSDKDAGVPCRWLQPDFRCAVHDDLKEKGLKGCIAFDCFGAGQKAAQETFCGHDWRQFPESAKHMFEVFLILRQLHELLWYLNDAFDLNATRSLHERISFILEETEHMTHLSPEEILKLDVPGHREAVNKILLETGEMLRAEVTAARSADAEYLKRTEKKQQNDLCRGADLCAVDLRKTDLRGANLRGACLIAADLRGTDLRGTELIGTDLRDADIRGADLSGSIFLTQAQINTAKGDGSTKLPDTLDRPLHWE